MTEVLLLAAPLYLLIGAGYAAVKSRYLPPDALGGVGQFVLKICVPVIIFSAVASPGSVRALNWGFIGGYAGAALLSAFAVTLVMMRFFDAPKARAMILGLGSASANSVFLGLPITAIVFHDFALTIFAWIMIAENLIVIPLMVALADSVSDRRKGFFDSLVSVLTGFVRSPLMIALALGLLVSLLGVVPPAPIEKALKMTVAAAPVMSLVLVGGFVARERIRGLGAPVALIAGGKLVLHPLLTALVLSFAPGVTPPMVLSGVLFASVPMFTIFTVLAARHGGEALASAALVATTLASAVSVNIVLLIVYALR